VVSHLARVKAAGLPVREEMGVDCCHANQDKFWVSDPDGVEWEVYHLNFDVDAPRAERLWSLDPVMRTVIFACVHNAGRSQMAAAFFNRLADPALARAISAGTRPAARVHAAVVEAMEELGIELSSARPQQLTTQLATGAELLVTMGCGEECPVLPGLKAADWPLPDPKDAAAAGGSPRSRRDPPPCRGLVAAMGTARPP
jgi:arsenate reductase